jgi:hypothetical protein
VVAKRLTNTVTLKILRDARTVEKYLTQITRGWTKMMNKNLGSKKKVRKAAYLERQAKKAAAREKNLKYIEAMKSGNVEQIADAMGVRLK